MGRSATSSSCQYVNTSCQYINRSCCSSSTLQRKGQGCNELLSRDSGSEQQQAEQLQAVQQPAEGQQQPINPVKAAVIDDEGVVASDLDDSEKEWAVDSD